MNIHCDNVIADRKLDIVIVNKMEKTSIIIDVAIPEEIWNSRVRKPS